MRRPGDVFVTSAVYDDRDAGAGVLHFSLPISAEGVRVLSNWRTIGTRATGSDDVLFEGVFVPEAAIMARRPKGVWHPVIHLAGLIAFFHWLLSDRRAGTTPARHTAAHYHPIRAKEQQFARRAPGAGASHRRIAALRPPLVPPGTPPRPAAAFARARVPSACRPSGRRRSAS